MPCAHVFDIGAEALGQVGELVHEADLGREHGVRRVLGELGRANVHADDAIVVAVERLVQRLQQLGGARVVGADNDAIGLHEVADGVAFLEELGIGDDIELDRLAAFLELLQDRRLDLVGRTHRHRRLIHDDAVLVHVLADGARDGQHVLEIGRAVLIGRRAHGNELEQAVIHGFLGVGRELEAPGLDVAFDIGLEAGLVDRNLALVQASDLVLVDVVADDVVAHFGHAGACDEADIAGAEDGQSHRLGPEFTRNAAELYTAWRPIFVSLFAVPSVRPLSSGEWPCGAGGTSVCRSPTCG